MQFLIFSSALFVCSLSSTGGLQPDLSTLQTILTTYNDAGAQNDVAKLEPILHEHFRVLVNDTAKGTVSQLDRQAYLDLIGKKVIGGQERQLIVEHLDLDSRLTATAKVVQASDENKLQSYFTFAKENGKWYIVQVLAFMSE